MRKCLRIFHFIQIRARKPYVQIKEIFKMAIKKFASLSSHISRLELPQTGIPIIIRPFVVKKAFLVHPKATTFQADLKAQWLTKTCLIKGLPSSLTQVNDLRISNEVLKYIKGNIEKSILHVMVSQKIGLKWKMRYDADLISGFLQSLLLPCWHVGDHLRESFLDFQPSIKTHWSRNHNFYQTRFNVGCVLRTSKPLPVFEGGKNTYSSHHNASQVFLTWSAFSIKLAITFSVQFLVHLLCLHVWCHIHKVMVLFISKVLSQ